MLSTDPSYDKRTIATTLKMQIRTVQRLRAQLNASGDPLGLGVSHITVNACVKEDLKCRSYRHQTSQILTEKTKKLRLIKSVRPPSSPDLNPLDDFVWLYVENITNIASHNTKASLIADLRRVFTELPPALVEKACSQFRIRIEEVIEAEGGYIE